MANEEPDFAPFAGQMTAALDVLHGGHVFFVVDRVSTDRTRELCDELAARDSRFTTVWVPETRHVVDAYLAGFRAALRAGFQWIVEMDAGLSHDPATLSAFLEVLAGGCECAFGSRFVRGGSMADSPAGRIALSLCGTVAAWVLLGSRMRDMTSGYEAFTREVLEKLVAYPLKSRAHFYQTEVRHLLRARRWREVPIHYRAPSPRVSHGAIRNAFLTLAYYTAMRIIGRSPQL